MTPEEFHRFLAFQQAQLYVVAGGFALFLVIESLLPLGRAQPWRARLVHVGRNAGLWLISTLMVSLLFGSLPLVAMLWIPLNGIGLFQLLHVPYVAQVVLGFLLIDAADYLFHRLSHDVRWLWLLHAVHHTDTSVDVSTNLRGHPLHVIAIIVWKLIVMSALGCPAWVLVARELIAIPIGQLHHARVRFGPKLERALGWLIVTPAMHRVHHRPEHDCTDSNFGAIFSFWDRLFGTYRAASNEAQQVPPYGLRSTNDVRWQTIAGMLTTPVRARSFREL